MAYIGSTHKHIPVSHAGGFFRRFLPFALCVALALLLIFNLQLYPGIASLASAAATRRAQGIMAAAFSSAIAGGGDDYADFVQIGYRSDGAVSSLTCSMPKLNDARNQILLSILDSLQEEDAVTVALPLGNLFGGEVFSGRGPLVPVRVLLAPGARAYMESDFRSAGINQTLHRILFTLQIHLTVMVPTKPLDLTVTGSYCVAETIIVGEVPDAFTQISRLTDDVTEEDIDDCNDFGAHL